MKYDADERVVMTLDAGGTNFDFSAVQANRMVVEPLRLPSRGDNLDRSLDALLSGFADVRARLKKEPTAISFSFPGPADYPNGIIGDLVNLPAYHGGIAVGPLLEQSFGVPVFINNDGDLFAYGEAIAGFLPEVNNQLEQAGSPKRYENLLGITLGTGFGAGIVHRGELFLGDNAAAAEIWTFPNKFYPAMSAEESVSIRGIRRFFAEHASCAVDESPSPKEIFEIADGSRHGNSEAAINTFVDFGEAVGNALAYASSLIDGLIVIGGGIAGAASLFLPALVSVMNRSLDMTDGSTIRRTEAVVYNLEDADEMATFMRGDVRTINVPGTSIQKRYDPLKRVGIGISKLGTGTAMAIGAYAFALHELDAAGR
jgi:glucokinase